MACADDLLPVRIKTEVMEKSSENTRTQLPAHITQDMTVLGLDTDVQSAQCGEAKTSTCSVSIRDETSCDKRNITPFSKKITKIVARATLACSETGLMGTVSSNSPNHEIEDGTYSGNVSPAPGTVSSNSPTHEREDGTHSKNTPAAPESVVKTVGPNFTLAVAIKKEVEDSGYDVAARSSGNVCANSGEENLEKMAKTEVVDQGYDTASRDIRSTDSTRGGSTSDRDDTCTRSARARCAGDPAVMQAWSDHSLPNAPVKSEIIDEGLFQSQLDVCVYEKCVDVKSPGEYESTDEDVDLASDLGPPERIFNDRKAFMHKRQDGARRQQYGGTADAELESQDETDSSACQNSDSEDSSLQQRLATLSPPQEKRKRCNQKSTLTAENPSHCVVCSLSSLDEKEVAAHAKWKKTRGLKKTIQLTDIRNTPVGLNNKDLFQCKNCDRSFMFAADLLSHLACHEETRECSMSILAKRKRGKGKGKPHIALAREPRSKPFEQIQSTSVEARTCPVCESVFSSVQTLQIHMKNPNQPLLDTLQHQGISECRNVTSNSEGKKQHSAVSSRSGNANVNQKKICHSKPACRDGNEGGSDFCVLDCPHEDSQLLSGTAGPQITQPTDERFPLADRKDRDKVSGVKRQSAKSPSALQLGPGSLLETPPLTCGCKAVPRQDDVITSPLFTLASALDTGTVYDDQEPCEPRRRRKRRENLVTRRGQQAIPEDKAILVKSQSWDSWSSDELALNKGAYVKMTSNAAALKILLTEAKIPDRSWTNPDNDLSPPANLHSDSPLSPHRDSDSPPPQDRDSDSPPPQDRDSDSPPPQDRDSDSPPPQDRDIDLPSSPNRDIDLPPLLGRESDLSLPPNPHTDLPPLSYRSNHLPPHRNRDTKLPPPLYRNSDPAPPPNPHSDRAARGAEPRAMEAASVRAPRPVERPFLCKYCCQHFVTAEQHDEHQAAQHTGQVPVQPPAALSDLASQPATRATWPQYSQKVRCPTGTVTRDTHFAWPLDDCSVSLTSTGDANAASNSGVTRRVVNKLSVTDRSKKRLVITPLTARRGQIKRGCLSTRLTTYSLTTPEDNLTDEPDPKGPRVAGSLSSPSSSTRRVFSCRYCEGVFSTPQGLSAHQRVHIKSRPHDCNECTQRFTSSHELELHKRSQHVGCVPFLCSLCNATFPTSKGANIHLAKHERERAVMESAFKAKGIRSHKSGVVPAKVYVPLTSPVIVFSPKTSCPPRASAASRRETGHSDHMPAWRDTHHLDGTHASRQTDRPDHMPAWRETSHPDHTSASLESSATSLIKSFPSGPSRALKTSFTNIRPGPRASSAVKTLPGTERNAPNTRQRMKGSVVTGTREEEPGRRPVTAVSGKAGLQCDQGVVLAAKDERRVDRDALVLTERDRPKRCNLGVKTPDRGHSGAREKQRRKLPETQLSDDRALVQVQRSKGSRPWVKMFPSQGYADPPRIAKYGSGAKASRGLTLHFVDTECAWSELSTPLLKKGQFKGQSPGRNPPSKQYNRVPLCTSCSDTTSHEPFLAHIEEQTRGKRSHSEDVKRLKSIGKDKRLKNTGKDTRFNSPMVFPKDKTDDSRLCPRWPDSHSTAACTPSADERKASGHKCHICKKKFSNARRLWQHRLTHFSELK